VRRVTPQTTYATDSDAGKPTANEPRSQPTALIEECNSSRRGSARNDRTLKHLLIVCALSVVFFDGFGAGQARAGGLEYDQIVFRTADVAAHPPGLFDADLAAIKTATLNGELGTVASRKRMMELSKEVDNPAQKAALMLASQIPFFGTMGALIASNALKLKFIEAGKTIGNSATQAYQTEQRLGKWYHVVYLNGWTRREDVANQTVLIVKPDDNQRIYLDLALQTYYTTPATDSATTETQTRAVMCAPSTTVDSGPQALNGIDTELFKTTFTTSQMSVIVSRYESKYTEPPKRDESGNLIPFDCPAGTSHTGPPMPTDRVSVYSTMVATYGATVASSLEEIGNIDEGDKDAALFAIPAGFKEKRPGALGP
jgi:hypothetical protein